MAGFLVTPETLQQAAARCNGSAAEIQGQLNQLRSLVASTADLWKGSAANQFNVLMAEYNKDSALITQALEEMGVGLQSSSLNYSDAEQSSITNLANVHVPPAKLG